MSAITANTPPAPGHPSAPTAPSSHNLNSKSSYTESTAPSAQDLYNRKYARMSWRALATQDAYLEATASDLVSRMTAAGKSAEWDEATEIAFEREIAALEEEDLCLRSRRHVLEASTDGAIVHGITHRGWDPLDTFRSVAMQDMPSDLTRQAIPQVLEGLSTLLPEGSENRQALEDAAVRAAKLGEAKWYSTREMVDWDVVDGALNELAEGATVGEAEPATDPAASIDSASSVGPASCGRSVGSALSSRAPTVAA